MRVVRPARALRKAIVSRGLLRELTPINSSQSGDWSGNVFDFILKVIPRLHADLKVPFMFKGNLRNEDTPLHKTVREATVNMLANADFYGRRDVVVQKSAEGFKFANPGCIRVSLNEALHDSASDPCNGVMMKMLAMVEYEEDSAVYTILVGLLDRDGSVIYFLPAFADAAETTSGSLAKFNQ